MQWRYFSARPFISRSTRKLVYVGTPLASVVLCIIVLVTSPSYLRFLGVIDAHIVGRTFPILPLAYATVVLVGTIAVWTAGFFGKAASQRLLD